ncbi:glycoside hydrolase family 10 [Stemphylium lycopersici]|nr:glycoside hydrolase family 10 [Stemphylium lycopersici]RAR01077.1 glycoside hydrolase family 10 [Stemphylium lycopersici]
MAFMEYEGPRRCLPHHLSYPNYIYDERNTPLSLAHNMRETPRNYPVGGPVGGMHTRANMGREDPVMETGPPRRRIAVACARCRKRKIRCTGDPGNGSGCSNCKSAGLDARQCQFHRVGSDAVHKVMDNINMAHNLSSMASAHQMMPSYPAGSNNTLYQRPMQVQQYAQYPHLDTRSAYTSDWPVTYHEDTSPVEAYNLDQSSSYMPTSTTMTNANMYGPSYRGTHSTGRTLSHGGPYFDQGSFSGLPYTTPSIRMSSSDISPLDTSMSSLQLSLPERPHPRQPSLPESSVPQRQLPRPQVSGAQTSRNAVDQQQDARLRSAQAMGASIIENRGSFSKSSTTWGVDGGNQGNGSGVASLSDATQLIPQTPLSDSAENSMGYIPTTKSTSGDSTATSAGSQLELNFSTSELLDGMRTSAPATTYSCVRGSRQMVPPGPQTNLYSFSTAKRNSSSGDLSNDCALSFSFANPAQQP